MLSRFQRLIEITKEENEKTNLYDPQASPYKIPRQVFIDNFLCTPTKKNIEEKCITEEEVKEIFEELQEEKREEQYQRKLEKNEKTSKRHLEALIDHGLDDKPFVDLDCEAISLDVLSRVLPAISSNYDQIGGVGDDEVAFFPLCRGKLPEIVCNARFTARNEEPWNDASEELVVESSILQDGSIRNSTIRLKFDGAEYLIEIPGENSRMATATVRAVGADEETPVETKTFDEPIGEMLAQRKQKALEEKEKRRQAYFEKKACEEEEAKKPIDRLKRALGNLVTRQ